MSWERQRKNNDIRQTPNSDKHQTATNAKQRQTPNNEKPQKSTKKKQRQITPINSKQGKTTNNDKWQTTNNNKRQKNNKEKTGAIRGPTCQGLLGLVCLELAHNFVSPCRYSSREFMFYEHRLATPLLLNIVKKNCRPQCCTARHP